MPLASFVVFPNTFLRHVFGENAWVAVIPMRRLNRLETAIDKAADGAPPVLVNTNQETGRVRRRLIEGKRLALEVLCHATAPVRRVNCGEAFAE